MKQESILATLSLHRTENYTLDSAAKRDAFRELGLNPNTCNGDFVELFASKENADAEYFSTPKTNNTRWYDWGKLGAWKMLYANPPFSKNTPHVGKSLCGPSYGRVGYSRREEVGRKRKGMRAYTQKIDGDKVALT